jgi:2-acylglycerol O-acyltransferase 2
MAAPTAAPLNAEPTQPEDRKKQHLPPKSYADAVEEPPVNSTNRTGDINGANGGSKSDGANGATDDASNQTRHKASVLRIVNTSAPDTKEKQEERPAFERQESKHEYFATVCSSSPFVRLNLLNTIKGSR